VLERRRKARNSRFVLFVHLCYYSDAWFFQTLCRLMSPRSLAKDQMSWLRTTKTLKLVESSCFHSARLDQLDSLTRISTSGSSRIRPPRGFCAPGFPRGRRGSALGRTKPVPCKTRPPYPKRYLAGCYRYRILGTLKPWGLSPAGTGPPGPLPLRALCKSNTGIWGRSVGKIEG
jgi:hypothetical protein